MYSNMSVHIQKLRDMQEREIDIDNPTFYFSHAG